MNVPVFREIRPHLNHAPRHGQLRGVLIQSVVESREVEQVAHLIAVACTRVCDAQHALEEP